MSKWDAASRVVNDLRAIFNLSNEEIRNYGLQDTYTDINAFATGLRDLQLPDRTASALLLAFRDWAPLAYWNRYRQVYTMHPTLTRELRATGVDDKIPGQILQRLPHPDPMIVFPDGIDLTLPTGEQGKLIAVNISGAIVTGPGHANYASTHDEASNGLYFNALAEVHDARGKRVDWDFCHNSIPISDESFTIASVLSGDRDYYTYDGRGATEGLDDPTLAYVHQVVGIALAHLLYIVSSNADIDNPRNTTSAQNPPPKSLGAVRALRPIKHQPVGYIIGPAMDAARRDHASDSSATGTGGTKSPHMRRAHFHTVRFGTGRSESKIEWFPPIPVKWQGTPDKPTIHGY